jgi:hypothetical protein
LILGCGGLDLYFSMLRSIKTEFQARRLGSTGSKN